MAPSYPATLGVILAGGLARRMGGRDKSLLTLNGRTLLDRVADCLAPQCEGLILNANGDASRFQETSLPVVPDSIPDHPGPLAGILTALEWAAAHRPSIGWVVSVPADTPFVPADLVPRLHEAREAARRPLACAASGPRLHAATGLWPVHLRHHLRRAITEKGMRRMTDWVDLHGAAPASWADEPFDPFFNINTPEDLAQAQRMSQENGGRILDDRA